MNKRIFVFYKKTTNKMDRPYMVAIPENEIKRIESQFGSQNCYLIVNGYEVEGSFNSLIEALGERVDFK